MATKRKRNPQVMRGSMLVVTLTLEPEQVAAIDREAERRNVSRAALVREAIDFWRATNIALGNIPARSRTERVA